MKILATGANGWIGSETVSYFDPRGYDVPSIDNNMRADFLGEKGDTRENQARLLAETNWFLYHELDIRDQIGALNFFETHAPDAIVHCAVQPSHDLATGRPFDDFDVNAGGILNLLEATRRYCKELPFVFLSSNKVYGDGPTKSPRSRAISGTITNPSSLKTEYRRPF